jgi:hypothetical protein
MNKKERDDLSKLFGNSEYNLSALSSSYCEGDEGQFIEQFGFDFKRALHLLTLLNIYLNK